MTERSGVDRADRGLPLSDTAAAQRLVLASTDNPALDRLAALAARLVGVPSAQISLLTEVQTVAGGAGLPPGTVGGRNPRADSLCAVTVDSGRPMVVTEAATDPRVADLPPVVSGAVGSYLGVMLTASAGQTLGSLCLYDSMPRQWSQGDVDILQGLAPAVVAELELSALSAEYEANRDRWRLAVDAAGIGSFDWDLVSGHLMFDERLLDLFGYRPDTFDHTIEAFSVRLHPDDGPRVAQAIAEAIDSCGPYEAEYRVVRPGMDTRWVLARGAALRGLGGKAVKLIGAAYDTTDIKDGQARVTRVLDTMSASFYSLDAQWRFTYVNPEVERLLGRPAADLLGGVLWELFPAALGSPIELHYRDAMASGKPQTFETYYPAPLNGWFEVRAWPGPEGLSVYFLDITDRRLTQERTARAAERAALLAQIASELAGTLDAEELAMGLTRLVVPALADYALVTVMEPQGPGRRGPSPLGWWHPDPALRPAVPQLSALWKQLASEDSPFGRTLTAGRHVVMTADVLAAAIADLGPGLEQDQLRLLKEPAAAVFPLRAHRRTMGTLSLLFDSDTRTVEDVDLETAHDVAALTGLALDNAQLYDQQRQLAEGLQRSLLTAPPEPDHCQIVVRYQPAAHAAQVGGDWYDAFLQADGATVLVIGDVVGHDTQAAAAMSQLRSLLRGIAATTGDGPADVLRRLDQAMALLQVDTTATVLVARLEQTPDEVRRGVTRLRWSNAGHPPPIALHPDGAVTVLGGDPGAEADLLLGIDPATPRAEREEVLQRDATLLLYTDGLVERRSQSLDEGLTALCETLRELRSCPLDEMCDSVLAQLLPARSEDDVALVAVRLHRQDRPRPAEAGPIRIPDQVD